MYSKDLVLGLWVPATLGIALLIAGWALPKFDADLPPWMPIGAVIFAVVLIVIAIFMAIRISRKHMTPTGIAAPINQNVNSYKQKGGVTAHTVSIADSCDRPH